MKKLYPVLLTSFLLIACLGLFSACGDSPSSSQNSVSSSSSSTSSGGNGSSVSASANVVVETVVVPTAEGLGDTELGEYLFEEEVPGQKDWDIAKSKSWPFNMTQRLTLTDEDYKLADDLGRRFFIIVLDDSGSMSGSRMRAAKRAVTEFAEKIPESAYVGLVSFRGAWPIRPFTQENKADFITVVNDLRANQSTPLGPAIYQSVLMLTKEATSRLGCGEYTMIVATDGAPNSDRDFKNALDYTLNFSPVNIFAVGFGTGGDHPFNQPDRLDYVMADDYESLLKSLEAAISETDKFDPDEF